MNKDFFSIFFSKFHYCLKIRIKKRLMNFKLNAFILLVVQLIFLCHNIITTFFSSIFFVYRFAKKNNKIHVFDFTVTEECLADIV